MGVCQCCLIKVEEVNYAFVCVKEILLTITVGSLIMLLHYFITNMGTSIWEFYSYKIDWALVARLGEKFDAQLMMSYKSGFSQNMTCHLRVECQRVLSVSLFYST